MRKERRVAWSCLLPKLTSLSQKFELQLLAVPWSSQGADCEAAHRGLGCPTRLSFR